MRWQEVQDQLLPMSGVAVIAPWLVIAPAGNSIIRLDLRLIDSIEIRPESEDDDPADLARLSEIVLTCGELDVGLYIADGPEAAARIVKAAAPLTRSGSETEPEPQPQTSSDSGPLKTTAKFITISSIPDAHHATDDALAGQVFALSKELTLIGSGEENDVIIEHDSVSGTHAKLIRDASSGRYHLSDLNSTNGVHVNGEQHTAVVLEGGDIVDLGHVRMRFESRDDFVFEDAGPASLERFLLVGKHPVLRRKDLLQVGDRAFRIDEVRDYSLQGANLPLAKQQLLQAAIAMLVVAASDAATA